MNVLSSTHLAPNAAQQEAIRARGNVLLAAGAGTGKTQTLIAKCLECICRDPEALSVDEILVVTFTDAAAAELRARMRGALEALVAAHPQNARLAEQLALLDTALISTLHGFCLRLVRENFFRLGLDPQLSVLTAPRAEMLARETLDALLRQHYAEDKPWAAAVRRLIEDRFSGHDAPLRDLIFSIHRYAQSLANAQGWFAEQLAGFADENPTPWLQWLLEFFPVWRTHWMAKLRTATHSVLGQCLMALEKAGAAPQRGPLHPCLEEILRARAGFAARGENKCPEAFEPFFDEAAFLNSALVPPRAGNEATPASDAVDPLLQDWRWVRPEMTALLQLARQFGAEFTAAKRQQGALDFADFEQFALAVLYDPATRQPSDAARQWRERLKAVFVDEYQDINAAQDAILRALARDGDPANRFLVGDVKQSIYRFRRADPHIFQNYYRDWRAAPAGGAVIPLRENFRSQEGILRFVNAVFRSLMREEMGGVEFDADAELRFGNPEQRAHYRHPPERCPQGPPVEFHVWLDEAKRAIPAASPDNEREDDPGVDRTVIEREAHFIAGRLRQLIDSGFQVWERGPDPGRFRPMEWRDAVILLRAPRPQAEAYAKEFARSGIAMEVARGGFFDCQEVADLLNLLRLLDNPLQDLPLLGVLRSPLAGLDLNELAEIRLAQRRGYFWTALNRFHEMFRPKAAATPPGPSLGAPSAWLKAHQFLEGFRRWRKMARRNSLSACLEAILDDTHFEAWLAIQPRGKQQSGNVKQLLQLTREFDQFQRQGLFRFLRYVQAHEDLEDSVESARPAEVKAVRLMSIHQSKGLEFPVVVLAGLGQPFNLRVGQSGIILDEKYGLSPRIQPPHFQSSYPSLAYWLASRRQRRELLGEELRLLYVAMTRPCDRLILVGAAKKSKKGGLPWRPLSGEREEALQTLLEAKNFLGWLGPWMQTQTDSSSNGQGQGLFTRQFYEVAETVDDANALARHPHQTPPPPSEVDAAALSALASRIAAPYPHPLAVREPAKASVSLLRRRVLDAVDEEAVTVFQRPGFAARSPAAGTDSAVAPLTPAEIGTAHHAFLEWVKLDQTQTVEQLKTQARQLEQLGVLAAREARSLNLPSVQALWNSEVGQLIRQQAGAVQRELPFTARFSLRELSSDIGLRLDSLPGEIQLTAEADEYVVVQGVIDLAVLLPGEIWLLDYKTDKVTAADVQTKVEAYLPQLRLYAMALRRIYHRPVARAWLYFLSLNQALAMDLG